VRNKSAVAQQPSHRPSFAHGRMQKKEKAKKIATLPRVTSREMTIFQNGVFLHTLLRDVT
jgi:hypothetical protein